MKNTKTKMRFFYRPFERLFCSIETFFTSTGVGGNNLQVSAAISACQFINVMTILSLFTKNNNPEFNIYTFTIISAILFAFNWIYFKDSRVVEILDEYTNLDRNKRKVIGISSIIYILLSYILLIISFNI